MAFETLRTELKDRVLTLTLYRPDRLNAFTTQMLHEMIAAFDEIDANDEVRAVIVTGEGRAFCAGADLGSGGGTFDASDQERLEDHRDGGGQVTLRIFECKKPVIAAINGAAVGVGITMTLPMDVRLASQSAKIGFVFARRGIVLAGRLVSRVLPPAELLPAARALAREIADNTSAVSVALARQMLWRMLGADHPFAAHLVDSKAIFSMGRSADAYEGVQSFLEKRPAEFKLRVSKDMPAFYPWWKNPPSRG